MKTHDLFEFVNPHPVDFNELYKERKLPGNYELDRLWYDRREVRDMRNSFAHHERRRRYWAPRGGQSKKPAEYAIVGDLV
jgi:hypothetical protein